MKINNIYAVWVYVSNMNASIDFYRNKLGFTFKFIEDAGDWAEFDFGKTSFALLKRPESKGEVIPQKTRIMFEVDNIEKYKELLLKANVKLIGDILNEAYGKLLTIEDPDGHWLEIFQNKH